jgi:DMSO/TMAO reductase YedYZ molybdopterin-dependent catalytic subunit
MTDARPGVARQCWHVATRAAAWLPLARLPGGLTLRIEDCPGFRESYGYHNHGDPWRAQRYQSD